MKMKKKKKRSEFIGYFNIDIILFYPLPEGSLHSNDSVSDSSPPPAVVQTGVPTQVVQQVQTAQQVKIADVKIPKQN